MQSRGPSKNVGIARTTDQFIDDNKVAVGVDEASSGSVSGHWSQMAVRVVSGTPSTLTVYAAANDEGPFTPYWATGSAIGGAAQQVRITGIAVGEWVEVPVACFPAGALKFVGDSAGEIEVMTRK